MDEQNTPRASSVSRATLIAFVAALIAAVAVAAWMRSDADGRARDAEIERLRAEVQALGDRQPDASGQQPGPGGTPTPIAPGEPAPTGGGKIVAPQPEEGWITLSGQLLTHRFQINAPKGYRLELGTKTNPYAYVVAEPTAQNAAPTPDLVIRLIDTKDPKNAALLDRKIPGQRVVTLKDSDQAFLLTGWEDMEWDGFGTAAASFIAW